MNENPMKHCEEGLPDNYCPALLQVEKNSCRAKQLLSGAARRKE
jgi:hypothetical protein